MREVRRKEERLRCVSQGGRAEGIIHYRYLFREFGARDAVGGLTARCGDLVAERALQDRAAFRAGRLLCDVHLLEAEPWDDAALGVILADALDEAPLVLVLLEHPQRLADGDAELVGQRRHERARYGHEPQALLIRVRPSVRELRRRCEALEQRRVGAHRCRADGARQGRGGVDRLEHVHRQVDVRRRAAGVLPILLRDMDGDQWCRGLRRVGGGRAVQRKRSRLAGAEGLEKAARALGHGLVGRVGGSGESDRLPLVGVELMVNLLDAFLRRLVDYGSFRDVASEVLGRSVDLAPTPLANSPCDDT